MKNSFVPKENAIFYKIGIFKKNSKNLRKILPKSFQNPPKILPKSLKIGKKTKKNDKNSQEKIRSPKNAKKLRQLAKNGPKKERT